MTYGIHPEAVEDLRSAATYYLEQGGSELARAFLLEFERAVALVTSHPSVGAVWRHGKRRVITRRFPYSVIYTVAAGSVRVIAVAHQSRGPDYWRGRR